MDNLSNTKCMKTGDLQSEEEKCLYSNNKKWRDQLRYPCQQRRRNLSYYCMFHDREYVDKHKKEVSNKFKELVKEANENESQESLVYMRFRIPEIHFERFTFKKQIDFRGAHFEKANFRNAIFCKEVNFDSAVFSGEAEFTDATFLGEAAFTSVSFDKVDFRAARFQETANFHLAHASDRSAFDSAFFSGEADFTTTSFEVVNFHFTKFEKGANFAHSRFRKEANFIESKFSKEQDDDEPASYFISAHFFLYYSPKADFEHATFSEYVDFEHASFPARTIFKYSMFKLDANFSDASFRVAVGEDRCIICGYADFTGSTFLKRADFSNAKFRRADFTSTSFGEKTDFIKTEFMKVHFKQASFTGQATFYETILGNKPNFTDVFFENAQNVLFNVSQSLHATSFINTDITSVRFSEKVEWEREKKDPPHDLDLEALKAVYRNLRENYENSFRFYYAQMYHMKELDLKREYRQLENRQLEKVILNAKRPRAKKNDPIRKNVSLTGLYYHVSKYGYSYIRAIIAAIIVLAIPIMHTTIQQALSPEGINATKSIEHATNYTKEVLHIDKKNDLIGSLMGIAAIPILGAIILTALKRTYEIRRKS